MMVKVAARAAKRWQEEGFGESIHHAVVPSGLKVMTACKPGFLKKYALLGVNYGSLDNDFRSSLKAGRHKMPPGIAHFLEHKMFEKEDGDVMDKLTALGCSSNAMTSFNHTGYLIECSDHFDRALEVLLDFVTRPWFTEALVNKEKGIIAEEINMYRDDASWRGYMGVLESLYDGHPMSLDIAGTVDSIQEITAEDLYLCHRTFYTPTNMQLAVAGDVDPEVVEALAEEIMTRNTSPGVSFERLQKKPRRRPRRRRLVESMAVANRKLHLGCRLNVEAADVPLNVLGMALDLFLAAVMGKGGAFHQELYESNLIDDSFGFSASVEKDYAFLMIAGDTPDPRGLEKALVNGLHRAVEDGPRKADLRRARRGACGSFVRSLDSVSTSCWNLVDAHVQGSSYLGHGRELMKMNQDRVTQLARAALGDPLWAAHIIEPLKT